MTTQVATAAAYRLLHQGSLVLAQMEHHGIRIDTAYLNQTILEIDERIQKLEEEIKQTSTFRKWQEVFGSKTKLDSRQQLGILLFDVLKHPYTVEETETGRYRVDAEILRALGTPFTLSYLRLQELKKFAVVSLKGLREEVVDGYVHPNFHLHTVETFRSSSSEINFQNIPRRDEELGRLIRQAFIPRPGRVLVENDFGALEFRIAACFWNDPDMLKYASDKSLDIHRDMAAECYCLESAQVSKTIRQEGKNKFVFPKLYGSYWLPMAAGLWQALDEQQLCTTEGMQLKRHLKEKGISKLGHGNPKLPPRNGTFEAHIYDVEKRFEKRFPVFTRSKEQWWSSYQEAGHFRLMTGFIVSGIYSRNFLMNAPVQGPGFHCLLWSLIELQKWLKKNKFKTKLIGQIHDCIVADVPRSELQEYLHAVKRIISEELPQAWSWIRCPMEVECEIAETNWYAKKNWVEVHGRWQPK